MSHSERVFLLLFLVIRNLYFNNCYAINEIIIYENTVLRLISVTPIIMINTRSKGILTTESEIQKPEW